MGLLAGHFLLDRMWLNSDPVILFWPLLGVFPAWSPDSPLTPHLRAYNIVGEALGLVIVLGLARRHRLFERPRWCDFVKTGRLAREGRRARGDSDLIASA